MNNLKYYFLAILFTTSLLADTIQLKNGNIIEGKILNQTRTKIQIQTEEGKVLLIDKSEVQRIKYGPTRKELEQKQEEQRRQEELRRKQEEERKKQEEEQRRQEELKRKQEEERKKQEEKQRRQEELKRKQEEERKKQEEERKNILKRNDLDIGLGVGSGKIYPFFLKPINMYNFARNIGSKLLPNNSNSDNDFAITKFKNNVAQGNIYFNYYKNNWRFGLDIRSFDIKNKISNLGGTISQSSFYPWISEIIYSEEPDYSMGHLWIMYDFYQFSLFNNQILMGIKLGRYIINTYLKFKEFNRSNTTPNLEINDWELKTNSNEFYSMGLNIFMKVKSSNFINLGVDFLKGRYNSSMVIRMQNNNQSNMLELDYIKFNAKGLANGLKIDLSYHYEYYKNLFLFVEYDWNENRYKVNASGNFFKYPPNTGNNNDPPPILPSGLLNLYTFGEKKIAIEKISSISFGMGAKISFEN